MSKDWRPYAHHIPDAIDRIRRIQARGAIRQDDILSQTTDTGTRWLTPQSSS